MSEQMCEQRRERLRALMREQGDRCEMVCGDGVLVCAY